MPGWRRCAYPNQPEISTKTNIRRTYVYPVLQSRPGQMLRGNIEDTPPNQQAGCPNAQPMKRRVVACFEIHVLLFFLFCHVDRVRCGPGEWVKRGIFGRRVPTALVAWLREPTVAAEV